MLFKTADVNYRRISDKDSAMEGGAQQPHNEALETEDPQPVEQRSDAEKSGAKPD